MMTSEIDETLKNDLYTKQVYEGVYALDKLPERLKPRGLYIMNLDVSTESGSHWTLIKVQSASEGVVTYFDSLGRPPPKEIMSKLARVGQTIAYADLAVQSIFSQACGYHVLFVSYLITRNYDLKEIMIDVYRVQEKQYLRNDYLAIDVISTLTTLKKRPLIDWTQLFFQEKK